MRYWEIIEKLDLGAYWAEFLRTNPSNYLPYHNLQHTIHMIEDAFAGAVAENLAPFIEHPIMKAHILAAMFHDYGHKGGIYRLDPKQVEAGLVKSAPDSVNIQIAIDKVSGMLAMGFWPMGVSLGSVVNGIQATQFPYEIPAEELTLSGRILRDADILMATKASLLSTNLFGLSAEMGFPLELLAPRNKEFLSGIKQSTDWGKAIWAAHLPRILEEHDAFIRAWGSV